MIYRRRRVSTREARARPCVCGDAPNLSEPQDLLSVCTGICGFNRGGDQEWAAVVNENAAQVLRRQREVEDIVNHELLDINNVRYVIFELLFLVLWLSHRSLCLPQLQ